MVFVLLTLSFFSSATTPIEGLWTRACKNGALQIQMFENHLSSTNDLFFSDVNCQIPFMAFSNDGSFKLNGFQIDFKFQRVDLTIYTNELVADFNQRRVCGWKDWQKNDPREITGLKCAFFQPHKTVQVPKKDEYRYGIWKLENSGLYFGLLTPEKNGLSPETRPDEWDPRPYFRQR